MKLENDEEKKDELPIDDSFPNEHLWALSYEVTNFVSYLDCGVILPELSFHQKRKVFADVKYYFWDEPLLFRRCGDELVRRCLPK